MEIISSKKLVQSLSRNLWCLSEVAVGLAFFDDNITSTDKLKTASNMITTKRSKLTPCFSADSASNGDSREFQNFLP